MNTAVLNWNLSHTYQTLPPLFYSQAEPADFPAPQTVLFNSGLAAELGLLPVADAAIDRQAMAEVFTGNRFPEGARPIAQAYADYLFWLHYAEGSLMPLLVMSLVFRKIETRKMPFFVKPVARKIVEGVRAGFLNPQLKRHLEFVESRLAGRTWLLGEEISAADIMMSFPLQAAVARTSFNLPNVAAYVRRIETDPAYQRAGERIGKLELL